MSKLNLDSTLGDEVERRQAEKQPGEPDLRALIAITTQKLQDHMDDKHLGLSEEIAVLRRQVLDLQPARGPLGIWRQLKFRWARMRQAALGLDHEGYDL
jgi:hypothetical protein